MKLTRLLIPLCAFFLKCRAEVNDTTLNDVANTTDDTSITSGNTDTTLEDVANTTEDASLLISENDTASDDVANTTDDTSITSDNNDTTLEDVANTANDTSVTSGNNDTTSDVVENITNDTDVTIDNNDTTSDAVVNIPQYIHVARGNGSYSAHRPNILEITYEEIPEFIVLTDGSGWVENPKAGALSGGGSRPSFYETLPPLDLVLTGQIQMMDLTCEADSCSDLVTECTGCRASFCMTNIDLVTSHPERYPSYMYVTDTEHCQKQAKIFDLNYIYDKVVEYDTLYPTNVNLLNLTTAFFEMGFTNTERLMQGLSIDHTKMVLVNPQPMDEAISICDNKAKGIAAKRPCDRGKVVDLVKKVNYLMCRTSDIYYEDCVVKYSTDSAKAIDIFEMAHLKASDYFVYMDPVLYIGAAMRNAEFPERALCAKHKRNPSAAMVEGFKELGKKPRDATVPELCAMEANIAFRRASATANANGRLLLLDADTLMDNVTDVANCDVNPNSNICQNVQKITDLSNKDIYGTVDPNREEKRKARLEANTTPETRRSARAGLIDAFVSAGLATQMPSLMPSDHPSDNPSSLPTRLPTNTPTNSQMPSLLPSLMPSMSKVPSNFPTVSINPSVLPSLPPSDEPSRNPTRAKICADSGTPNYNHCWREGWRREEHCRRNYQSCAATRCNQYGSGSYCCKCGGGRWYYP